MKATQRERASREKATSDLRSARHNPKIKKAERLLSEAEWHSRKLLIALQKYRKVPVPKGEQALRCWTSLLRAMPTAELALFHQVIESRIESRIGLDLAALERAVLSSIAVTKKTKPFQSVIAEKAAQDDIEFFEKLGRALSRKRKGTLGLDDTDRTILSNWNYSSILNVGLKFFTDPAAARVFPLLGGGSISSALYTKRRSRLKLRADKNRRIRGYKRNGASVEVLEFGRKSWTELRRFLSKN